MKKICCLLGLVALAAGSAKAGVYTWTGGAASGGANRIGDWNNGGNWAEGTEGAAPGFDHTSDIKISGAVNLDQYSRVNTVIKSLEFTSSNTGATAIGLVAANGTADRDLTFSADAGNSTLTVDAASGGDKTIGANLAGVASPGEIVLLSNLDIVHNGAGNLALACEIRGAGDVSLVGSGLTVFSGINTYTGNTMVDGALVLSDGAQLAFSIGTNGVNNALSGSGTVSLDGDFLLDLRVAGVTPGDSWQLVDVNSLTATFGSTFSLVSTAGSFSETNGVWSISEYGAVYEFAENTGMLTVVSAQPEADWMSGKWGIGWRFRADEKDEIANWDVDTLVSQVKSIFGVDYVVFNLSDGAHGDAFVAPHSVLTAITPSATPNDDRDLFMEMATAFQAEGIKVIAYIAAQGPAMLKHGAESAFDSIEISSNVFTSVAMDNWSNYVYSVYNIADFADEREMYKRAFGEVILDEYAARYGSLIDGWWFDNGDENYDAELVYAIAKQHNPHVAVGTSSTLSQNTDFLNGHPVPLKQYPANDLINLPMLTAIEATPGGYLYIGTKSNLGHMFMALGELWNIGDIVWPLDQAADWMTRCLNAGGAWTWNVDLDDDNSMIRADMATYFTDLNVEIAAMVASNTAAPAFSQDTYDGGSAQLGAAYTGSVAGAATDADGDTVTYAIAPGGPDWLVVSTNGSLSGTPYNTWDLGINRFTLIAADGKGRIDLAELEIYVTDESGSGIPHFQLSFNNLRGLIGSMPTINGANITDPNVSITKATNGNDVVYSLSIINQDLDGGGTLTDSLSWDIRVKAFAGGSFFLNGNDSSVTLGSNVLVGTINKEFGVSGSDNRYMGPGESVQFSVENLVLTADAGFSAHFDGFGGLWGTAGSYIYGEGASGLESQITTNSGDLAFAANTILAVTAAADSERVHSLDGSFTVSAAVPAVTNVSFSVIHDGGVDYPGMIYTRVITPEPYLIETSTNLTTSSWVLRHEGPAESDITIVTGPVDNSDGTETLSFRLNQGLDANSNLFIRVQGTE
ncbi:Ig domain-containing protein [Pontiellaceae bacterium B12227]|nr:Ig domain-containing protein [Pontiellaceae bacterium B12227]